VHITSNDRFSLLKKVNQRFAERFESFSPALLSNAIRSYTNEDCNSPGLLSLAALPFWLGEKHSIDYDVCMDMAVGNLFLLHCFQSFDFIIDGDRPQTDLRAQTVLGNLCYQQVTQLYQPYFYSAPVFWERTCAYWNEWAESIMWELELQDRRRAYEDGQRWIAAHKAAALKICPAGLAILANRSDLIPAYEKAVDWMHATMQLLDDLNDWREDLEHHRYNSFLSLMIRERHIPVECKIAPEEIYELISSTDILIQFTDLISRFATEGAAEIGTLGIEPWAALMNGLSRHGLWLTDQIRRKLQDSKVLCV
jgi:hypothetical protein